ncbi:uncharacterized protein [Macrobrachium rosenbergii]|uniref:uncharacterized protein n=1 Tax=Macrobrachium rosenbergii TaxID=79674 RepID=UPI0034D583B8
MNENFRFFFSIALLMLLAMAAQSDKNVPKCEENGGFCVPRDLCNSESEFLYCDGENEVCCRYNPLSKTKRSPRDIGVPCWHTAPPEKCEVDYNGVCQSTCEDGRIPTGVCSGDCLCCGCPTTDKCRESSGYCTVNRCSCDGIIIPNWCIGEKCICCLPEECLLSEECALPTTEHAERLVLRGEEPLPGASCWDVVGDSCVCCVPSEYKSSTASGMLCESSIEYEHEAFRLVDNQRHV